MNRFPLGLVSIFIVGCVNAFPITQKGSCLVLKPQVNAGYLAQTVVSVYTSASIDHLTIKLMQGSTEIASKSVPQIQLSNTIAFSNLRANTSYRIKSFAYLADNTLISHDDASSWVDITTGTDDRPTLAALPVHLLDRDFNGQGTGSLQITNGGYLPGDPETGRFSLSEITTVAGNGTPSISGDGGQATLAGMNTPCGIALDGNGNLFVAEYGNNRIRKVATNGTISTVAGNGTDASSGDGGAATLACLSGPNGLAIDGLGNIYVSEPLKHRVRKISTNGTISTVAGNGSGSYSGDGGPATLACLNRPYGLAVDGSNNLYIVDTYNNRIRKVPNDGTISTVAGNGTLAYSGDGGQATLASLNHPIAVAADGPGNLYICDLDNKRVRKVTTSGVISTIAGNGGAVYSGDGVQATLASMSPRGAVVDALGNLYLVDESNNRIRKVTTSGLIVTIAGNGVATFAGDGGQAALASLNSPKYIAMDGAGNLYISDFSNNRLRKVY